MAEQLVRTPTRAWINAACESVSFQAIAGLRDSL
jgi:hypothetical protein